MGLWKYKSYWTSPFTVLQTNTTNYTQDFIVYEELRRFPLEEFKDTKGVIRILISKKNRQHNDQKKKYKKGQTTIYKTYT